MTTSTATMPGGDLRARLKAMWMAGDYDRFSRYLEAGARDFYERLDLAPGCRLLDVACKSKQLALLAARDGAQVTGVDIAGNLVARAKERAQAEGLSARFEEGDAEALPYEAARFDVVVSLIGAMFAPRPEEVAQELLRVCAPGGTLAMGNWTPQGFVGQMFKAVARFIAPSGMPSPVLWGEESVVRERLGGGLSELRMTRRPYPFSFPFPPSDVVALFRDTYGPINRAFATLDEAEGANLQAELEALWTRHNQAGPKGTTVYAEYLDILGTRA